MTEYRQTLEGAKFLSEAKIEQLNLMYGKFKQSIEKALTEKTETQNSSHI